jgi:hypothetical protein
MTAKLRVEVNTTVTEGGGSMAPAEVVLVGEAGGGAGAGRRR